jgi:hypothetical protein
MILVPMILPIWRRRFAAEIWAMPEDGTWNEALRAWRELTTEDTESTEDEVL